MPVPDWPALHDALVALGLEQYEPVSGPTLWWRIGFTTVAAYLRDGRVTVSPDLGHPAVSAAYRDLGWGDGVVFDVTAESAAPTVRMIVAPRSMSDDDWAAVALNADPTVRTFVRAYSAAPDHVRSAAALA